MSNIPGELKYTTTHEWVSEEENGVVSVGITDHAQELLGDLVYVELPETGTRVSQGDEVGIVESVKAASDIYAPLNGVIVAVNEALNDQPESVNQDPYDNGWIFKLKLNDAEDLRDLLSAEDYQQQIEAED